MNEEEVKAKRELILERVRNLSDAEIFDNDNFTFWGHKKVITMSHGGSHPPGPPPPPPGNGQ